MIRKLNDKTWFICYDANGEVFAGPFTSEQAAVDHFDGLCAFDQMVVNCRPPGCKTDNTFMNDTANGKQFETNPEQGDYYAAIAKKAGVSITGKKYMSNLCRDGYGGDPQAWVSGRGDVQRICEERGWGCTGDVVVKKREEMEAPPPPVPISPRLVEREVRKRLAGQVVKPQEVMDMREKVADEMTPPWKKKGVKREKTRIKFK